MPVSTFLLLTLPYTEPRWLIGICREEISGSIHLIQMIKNQEQHNNTPNYAIQYLTVAAVKRPLLLHRHPRLPIILTCCLPPLPSFHLQVPDPRYLNSFTSKNSIPFNLTLSNYFLSNVLHFTTLLSRTFTLNFFSYATPSAIHTLTDLVFFDDLTIRGAFFANRKQRTVALLHSFFTILYP